MPKRMLRARVKYFVAILNKIRKKCLNCVPDFARSRIVALSSYTSDSSSPKIGVQ